MKAIGVIEIASIAKGIQVCDQMIKSSEIQVFDALPMCPGKYVITVGGDVANVQHALGTALETGRDMLIDKTLIANIDEQVFKGMNGVPSSEMTGALGVIETFSAASGILAADSAVKAAVVQLMEIRLSRGMGGKTYITLTGSVGDIEEAVKAGCEAIREDGLLVGCAVIPSPHPELRKYIE